VYVLVVAFRALIATGCLIFSLQSAASNATLFSSCLVDAGLPASLAIVTSLSASVINPSGTVLSWDIGGGSGPAAATVAGAVLGSLAALLLSVVIWRYLILRHRAGKISATIGGEEGEDSADAWESKAGAGVYVREGSAGDTAVPAEGPDGRELRRRHGRRHRPSEEIRRVSEQAWGEEEEAELKAAAAAVVAAAATATQPPAAATDIAIAPVAERHQRLIRGPAGTAAAAAAAVAALDDVDECLREVNERLRGYGPVPAAVSPSRPAPTDRRRVNHLALATTNISVSKTVTRIVLERPVDGTAGRSGFQPPPPPPPGISAAEAVLGGGVYSTFAGPRPRVPAAIVSAARGGLGRVEEPATDVVPLEAGWGGNATAAAAAAAASPPRRSHTLLDRALAAERAEEERRRRRDAAVAATAGGGTPAVSPRRQIPEIVAALAPRAAETSPAARPTPRRDYPLPPPPPPPPPPPAASPPEAVAEAQRIRVEVLDARSALIRRQLGLVSPATTPHVAQTAAKSPNASRRDGESSPAVDVAVADVTQAQSQAVGEPPSPVRPYLVSPGTTIMYQRPSASMTAAAGGGKEDDDDDGTAAAAAALPRAVAEEAGRRRSEAESAGKSAVGIEGSSDQESTRGGRASGKASDRGAEAPRGRGPMAG
jgi:hypothetical protein